ncbi:MAG: hypothetical protein ACK2UU_06960, partial [Anaerolineae bacterium]
MKRRSGARASKLYEPNRWVHMICCLALLWMFVPVLPVGHVHAQTPAPQPASPADNDAWLEEMMDRMTTADKVGQLFL